MNAQQIKALGKIWGAQNGLLSVAELETLMTAAHERKPRRALEVGHYCGLSTCALVHALRGAGHDWELISVDAHVSDPWVQHPAAIETFEENRSAHFEDDRLLALYARSETISSVDAEFVFYDGDHHIEQLRFTRVVVDSPSVKDFVFDDSDFDIPRQCVAELIAAGWRDRSPEYRRLPGDKLNPDTQTLAWFTRH